MIWSALLVAILSTSLCAQTENSYKTIDVKDGGSITGQVIWQGDIPKEASTEVPVGITHQAACRCKKVSVDRLAIEEKTRGVADCVVYIQQIAAGKKMPAPGINLATGKEAVLDQIGCRYVPAVMIVPPRTELVITSSDSTSHNVNARLGAESRFNLLITRKGAKEHGPRTGVGSRPGVISLSCNAGHPWMSGYIHVVEHPYYALTDKEGRFELKDVPPGKYRLCCWHANWIPRLLRDPVGAVTEVQYGRPVGLTEGVEVVAGKSASLIFKLSSEAAAAAPPKKTVSSE